MEAGVAADVEAYRGNDAENNDAGHQQKPTIGNTEDRRRSLHHIREVKCRDRREVTRDIRSCSLRQNADAQVDARTKRKWKL